jgi:hypothetical protein
MNETSRKWREFKNMIKFWVAGKAIKFCGVEIIYWSSPLEWEEYMKIGKPLTSEMWKNEQ